ncbi:hypothetical protein NX059_005601 [Plenodomus lindquistii]|nr:hypothetical protein NX059_005601 [Plenodomus lindquistii]
MAHDQNVSTVYYASKSNQLLDRVRRELQDRQDAQNDIASARRDLLVQRETVRTTSRKVRLSRLEVGNAEAVFMNRFREYAVENDKTLPEPLRDAYDKVEQMRTFLGEMEANYLQMERDLTGAEWVFMDKETSFYQLGLQVSIPDHCEVAKDQPTQCDQSTPFSTISPALQKDVRPTVYTQEPPKVYESYDTPPDWPRQEITFDITATRRDLNMVLAELGSWQKTADVLRQEQVTRIEKQEAHGTAMETNEMDLSILPSYVTAYCSAAEQTTRLESEAHRLQIEEANKMTKVSVDARTRFAASKSDEDVKALTWAMDRAYTEDHETNWRIDVKSGRKTCEWLLIYLQKGLLQPWIYHNIVRAWESAGPESHISRAQAGPHKKPDSTGELIHGKRDLSHVSVCSDPGPGPRNNIVIDQLKSKDCPARFLNRDKSLSTSGVIELGVSTNFGHQMHPIISTGQDERKDIDPSTCNHLPLVSARPGNPPDAESDIPCGVASRNLESRPQPALALPNHIEKQQHEDLRPCDNSINSQGSMWRKFRPRLVLSKILHYHRA